MKLVFLDTETGGLDREDALVEVAWAPLYGPVREVIVPHDHHLVRPEAAAVNGYMKRGLGDPAKWGTQDDIDRLEDELTDATVVGCNPGFDTSAMQRWLFPGRQPWHYRMLDIESMAFQAGMRSAKTGGVPGLMDIVRILRDNGYQIPSPDHTAANDVRATRASFLVLASLGGWGAAFGVPATAASA